jgi:hypothetical protein
MAVNELNQIDKTSARYYNGMWALAFWYGAICDTDYRGL